MFCQKCYCAQYRGPELKDSTSGGVFYAFAKYVVENKGCVFGAAYDEQLVLRHVAVENIEDLKKIQGSKYVESDFIGVLPKLKTRLDNGQLCLFSGTPCQIAAVRSFLKKDYQNLLLIDILCHGTPSRELFQRYIAWRERVWNVKILNFEFRNKRAAQWGDQQKALITTDKDEKIIPAVCDPYFYAFQKGLIAQKKCYSCKFASPNRVGDITAADFWGIKAFCPDFPYTKGASCMLVNTSNGNVFFEQVKDSFLLEKMSFEDARKHNPHFNHPLTCNPIQSEIYKAVKEDEDFSKILPLLPCLSYKHYLFKKIVSAIKRLIKRVICR